MINDILASANHALAYLWPDPILLDIATLGTGVAAGMAWVLVAAVYVGAQVVREGVRTAMGLTITGELFLVASGISGGLCGTMVATWVADHPAFAYVALLVAYLWVRSRRKQGRDIFKLPALPLPAFFARWMDAPDASAHGGRHDRPAARPLDVQHRARMGL